MDRDPVTDLQADIPHSMAESAVRSPESLLHELQVYQTELEMQNAALRDSHSAFETSRNRYYDLYEFAPVGYLTLGGNARIAKINLAGAALLGSDRAALLDAAFGRFVISKDSYDWNQQFQNMMRSRHGTFTDELMLQRADGKIISVLCSCRVVESDASAPRLHMALTDVTERKKAEEALVQSQARLRKLAGHQESVREEERKRIARDIHDELGQTLIALRIDIASMLTGGETVQVSKDRIDSAVRQIDGAIAAVKAVIVDLRPGVLDFGLHAAVEWQAAEFQRRTRIPCKLHIDHEEFELDDTHAVALFRVLQESLTNIIRHAKATEVRIEMRRGAGFLSMTVSDNGIGLQSKSVKGENTFGLIGISERIAALGGAFSAESSPGSGTTLRFAVPC
ncbi:hypothetical protein BH11PSE11_BH11PSE11_21450 [soil metagenome]